MKDFSDLVLVAGFLVLIVGGGYALNMATTPNDHQCTITITDMQGVRHQIKGVADRE